MKEETKDTIADYILGLSFLAFIAAGVGMFVWGLTQRPAATLGITAFLSFVAAFMWAIMRAEKNRYFYEGPGPK